MKPTLANVESRSRRRDPVDAAHLARLKAAAAKRAGIRPARLARPVEALLASARSRVGIRSSR
jgi:hypothetical protein